MCLFMHAAVHTCVHEPQKLEVSSSIMLTFFIETVFLREPRACCLASLAVLQAVGILRSLPPRAGITDTFKFVGNGDSNSGP